MVRTEVETPQRTILLVEDEVIIALATKGSLEARGYRVLLAHTGEDAVAAVLGSREIDLVLMDIDLGSGIDGPEAAQRILAARSLPVVFLSSHTEQSLVDKVRGITRYGYVVKNSGDFVLNASIEMAFDLFEAHRREEAHADRYRALVDIATSCINPADADLPDTIRSALGTMAETIDADRAYVLDYDFPRGLAVNTYEWCAPGIEPQIEKLQAVPLEDISDGVELHRRGRAHHLPDVSAVPEGPFRSLLKAQGIKSLLTIPLESRGKCIGAVGFDRVRGAQAFSQEEHGLLTVLAEVLVNLRERRETEERLRIFFDSARDNILVHEVGPDGTPGPYVDVNPSTCETLGYTREELLSMSPIDTTEKGNGEKIRSILAGLANGESVLIEVKGRRKDGAAVPFELNLHRLKLQGRDSVIAISRDISLRKRQEEMQRRINEMAPVAIFVFDHNQGRLVFANAEYQRQLGYSLEELQAMGDGVAETLYHPEARERLLEGDRKIQADREGKVFETDYELRRKDGGVGWAFVRETVLSRNPDGSPEQVIGTGIDITDRKEAEELIAGLLKEKELLLTEVHHRIKNNMTAMISLLSLQAGMAEDPKVVAALTEAQSRMHSMTVLYDKLYRSENLSEISIADYLPPLVREIVATHGAEGRVTLTFDVGEYTLPVSSVAGLGVIVNELVTNALKYAFPDGGRGTITVTADRGEAACYAVTIGDDGVGLPASVSLGQSGGFGLMLVESLADQHGFAVSIERSGGTRFVIGLGQPGAPAGRPG